MSAAAELRELLRLVVLTRPDPACGRSLSSVVGECLEAGCRAIQLRDKSATAFELHRQAVQLLPLVRTHRAVLFINDRLDVALAAGAHGVHLGPEDLPLAAARRSAPRPFLIGYSTDDPVAARAAATAGADYLGVGAVYGTASKPGLTNEAVGADRVGTVIRASGLPCVGIGGITPRNAAEVAAAGAGIAVLSAVMDAARPGEVVRQLLEEIYRAGTGTR